MPIKSKAPMKIHHPNGPKSWIPLCNARGNVQTSKDPKKVTCAHCIRTEEVGARIARSLARAWDTEHAATQK